MSARSKSGRRGKDALGGIPPAAIRDQVERILASTDFARAARMKRFLQFVVEQNLEGRADELKEYTLALEVFDRGDSFDTATNSLVRVEAGRLRRTLKQYYLTHGIEDPVVIEIPTGSYAPVFRSAARGDAGRIEGDLDSGDSLKIAGGALALPDKPSIAVLPFENMSDDPGQEYFADGIAEDVITALSRFRSLFVIARNSSFSYKGTSPHIRMVARELGVRYVVEGSVRKAGNRVRITAQLIDATSGNASDYRP